MESALGPGETSVSTKPGNGHDKPIAPAKSVLSAEERAFLAWAIAANEEGTLTSLAHERVRALIRKARDAESMLDVAPEILRNS